MGLLFALFLLAFILFVAIADLRAISAVTPAPKAARPFAPGGWTPGAKTAGSHRSAPVPPQSTARGAVDGDEIKS